MKWSEADVQKAREHFWAFVYIVWRSIDLPQPTPIQIDIANYLQNPPKDRIILEGFRGVAKSFLTCAYVVWSDMIADKGQLDTQNIFDVGGVVPDISPSVKSIGITGQITGTRADILIADDKLLCRL